VTNTLDSGTGSLRDAVTTVNAGAGGDTIVFSGVTGTITLSSTLGIGKSVTINGPGATLLTISGNDTVQVFNAAVGTTVTISGLTIAHGFANPRGGGILSSGTLTVSNCIFSNNVAFSNASTNVGGAIATNGSSGALVVNNSTSINNKATGPSTAQTAAAPLTTMAISP
jgi:trimeric autotransporter adhesin